ncbi:MAG: TIGR03086 family metal-binding protein [Acidimicrobiia bacterium]
MELVERLERSISEARGVLAQTSPDQYGMPTPCSMWDVRQLVNHTIGAMVMFGDALTKGEADMSKLMGDLIGDDALSSFDAAAAGMVAAFRSPGALDGMVKLPFAELPAGFGIQLVADDVLVHGWDLAKAIGADVNWDQELASETLDFVQSSFPPEMRGDQFEAEVPVPANVDAMTQLVGALGRQP